MKYDIAVITSVLVAAVLIGASYLDSERTARHAVTVRTTVSSLSIQQLASEIVACDSFRGSHKARDLRMVYCAEVTRTMDAQPLQAVVIRVDRPDLFSPSVPRPMLQRFPVPAPEEPKAPIEQPPPEIRDSPRVS